MQKRIVVLGGVGFYRHAPLPAPSGGRARGFLRRYRATSVNSPLLRGVLQHPLFRYVHHNIINGFGIRCDEIYNLASPSRVRYNKALPGRDAPRERAGRHKRPRHSTHRTCAGGLRLGGKHLRHRAAATPASESGQLLLDALHPLRRQARRRGDCTGPTTANTDVDARIARIFNTYGSRRRPDGSARGDKDGRGGLAEPRHRPINGSGEQLRTFCWVEDLVEGLVQADGNTAVGRGGTHGEPGQQP